MSEQEPPTGPDDNAELVDRLEDEAGSEREEEKDLPDSAGSDTTDSVSGAPEPPD
jgi:hypothetical protein